MAEPDEGAPEAEYGTIVSDADLFKLEPLAGDIPASRTYRIITQEADGIGYSSLLTREQADEWAADSRREGVKVLWIEAALLNAFD